MGVGAGIFYRSELKRIAATGQGDVLGGGGGGVAAVEMVERWLRGALQKAGLVRVPVADGSEGTGLVQRAGALWLGELGEVGEVDCSSAASYMYC